MNANHKNIAWLLSAVLLVVFSIFCLFTFFGHLKNAGEMRKHTFITLIGAQELLSSLKDAETGQRGFLLTQDETFLQTYEDAKNRVPTLLAELHQLVSIPAAQQHLNKIDPLITAKFAYMAQLIEMTRKQKTVTNTDAVAAITATVRRAEGKRIMDNIRKEMNFLTAIEETALAQHDADFQIQIRRLFAVVSFFSVFVTLFAFAIVYFIYRNNQQHFKDLIHSETKRLLDAQEALNQELKQAYVNAQDSEQKLVVTLNSIGDGVIATDINGCVTLLNPIAEDLTGWTHNEAIGRPVNEIFHIIHKDTRELAVIPVIETLAKGIIQGLANHTVLIARDLREFDIADSCAPIRDRDNNVMGAVLVFRNVTVEYAVQQALADSNALVQTVLNTVADGIINIQANGGMIESVNPAITQMFGYSEAELVGKKFSMIIPELDHDHHSGSLEYYSASDETRASGLEREVLGRRKDGSTFPLEITASEMRLAGQRYFTSVLRNISVRKKVEAEQKKLDQRLRDQQFYTRSLIESNIDALMTTDPAGIISDVNRQMEALTGCTRDELIGAPFKNYFTEPERAEAGINRVLAENKVTNYELTARARDGQETIVSYNATTFFDRDRNLQGVFAAARDITERKHLDLVLANNNFALINAKSIAEKANLAKSDFLSSMSHELRTPLNAILGFAQLIESGEPTPTPIQKRSLDQILQAGWYLLDLINEILDLALIESGKLSLSIEPVSLADVMRECATMIEPQALKRGINVTFPVLDQSYCVKADRIRVKQVLINLLSNAIKYNRENGTVIVICFEDSPGLMRICVQDTGEGLSPEKIAQLFQPFNRLGQEVNAEEGTGIGLVMTKKLVELMGGNIGLESHEGKGSTFWIDLNLTTYNHLALDNNADTQKQLLPTLKKTINADEPMYTLLYVEDNPANLMLIEDLIQRRDDIDLLTARDGLSGIAIARVAQPDLILMDINLPGISGIDALIILSADKITAHIPVVALSANAIPSDIEKGLKAGFFRYLTKPIKVDEFMHTLDEALAFTVAQKKVFYRYKEKANDLVG